MNEAKKYGWKTYCSQLCQNKIKNKQKQLCCSRINCGKTFFRTPREIKGAKLYCSTRCAAMVNNSKFPKRKATISRCAYCHQKFKGRRIYCSKECKNKSQTISNSEILKRIKKFYKKHKRIPIKIEFPHYGAAQDRFGSWNKAIVAAGFDPNPVMFAKRFVADDGHQCDSFAEKVIDDWLYAKKIEHRRSVPYPSKSVLTADFLIGKLWVEFFGLAGALKYYDRLIREKRAIAEKHGLRLIEIYPRDLFPVNRLEKIIKI